MRSSSAVSVRRYSRARRRCEDAALEAAKAGGAAKLKAQKIRQQLGDEHERAVLAMLKDGKGPVEVGRELGVDDASIRKIAEFHGLKIDKRFRNGIQGRVIGSDDLENIAQMIAQGEKSPAIARDLGVRVESIYRAKRLTSGREPSKQRGLT